MTEYVVTYVEVAPHAAPTAAAELRGFIAAARAAPGCEFCTALAELGYDGRFAIVEGWREEADLAAHGAAVEAFRRKLEALTAAPFDARRAVALSVATPAAGQAAIHVLTHVDVVPANKDAAVALVQQLARDSRAESALRCDVLQQASRPNHMTLWESWPDRAALEAHIAAAHTRAFRQSLAPLQGALYDQRLYQPVR
jgi:quinol monooxygenase YgiN